jgi:hypothetical protein
MVRNLIVFSLHFSVVLFRIPWEKFARAGLVGALHNVILNRALQNKKAATNAAARVPLVVAAYRLPPLQFRSCSRNSLDDPKVFPHLRHLICSVIAIAPMENL